jgi:hypothetical protein
VTALGRPHVRRVQHNDRTRQHRVVSLAKSDAARDEGLGLKE